MDSSPKRPPPKILARACLFCRGRKIKCDSKRPDCGTCVSQKRECVYLLEAPKRRPSTALVNGLRNEKRLLEDLLIRVKLSPPEEKAKILDSLSVENGSLRIQRATLDAVASQASTAQLLGESQHTDDEGVGYSSDEDLDVLPFLSVGEGGNLDSFGPSSALQGPMKPVIATHSPTTEHIRNRLIANAILQRQREYDLERWQEIDGTPMELAKHLLDLHWSRQHHTFLLTYRPAIMRDLMQGGPFCSKFLVNAIFAVSSKFSQRAEVLDDPSDPKSAGRRFFLRCDEILFEERLLSTPSLPTIVGLTLLGSTYNARGETSKGWLYTGYALRMVYDLGLHLDRKETDDNAEEVEIRRRVFWGAFICDKLQSLYLGRPVAIHLRDAHVSRNFMDTIEEKELYTPYVDPKFPETGSPPPMTPSPLRSVSTFQQLCLLSKIMAVIIEKFYVVGATASKARSSLQSIDDSLIAWNDHLPAGLKYEPLLGISPRRYPPPNLMNLHAIYHSLIILLHRPFISDGHLRSAVAPASSWKRCTTAAKNITSIVSAYQSAYTLRAAPYLMSYAVYVACTIHVRNAAAAEGRHGGENSSLLAASLKCLDEISTPNVGVFKPASIIRKLADANKLNLEPEPHIDDQPPGYLDLEAILRMFPSGDSTAGDTSQIQSFGRFGNDSHSHEDLLYGFMDIQSTDLSDFSSSALGLDLADWQTPSSGGALWPR